MFSPRTNRRLLLASLVIASGCALPTFQVTDASHQQPATIRQPDAARAVIYIHWTADVDAIGRECGRASLYGCAKAERIGDDVFCHVYVQQPQDFNDRARLQVLGHETLHCFGGKHQ